jgi:CHASE3 domain sensor protein
LLVSQYTIAAETGERGYLITGEEVYLESYEGALADRSSRIASLEELAREIPEFRTLVPELKALIASRDSELETAIALRRAGNFDETVEAVRAGLRKNLSEQIRGVLQEMETIVTERLRLTQADYRHRIKQVTWIMTASAYLSLALGVLGLAFLTGHLRDQIRTMRLERDREEAVRLAKEKSRFLASMNHEIRTPLNALLGFCELLENEVHSSRGLRYLSAIRTSGTSLADLINDILDLSRIESGMLDLSPGAGECAGVRDEPAHALRGASPGCGADFRIRRG